MEKPTTRKYELTKEQEAIATKAIRAYIGRSTLNASDITAANQILIALLANQE